MLSDTATTLNSEEAEEYIHYVLTYINEVNEILEMIESDIMRGLGEIPLVSQEDVDMYLESNKKVFEEIFDNEIDTADSEKILSELNPDKIRQNLKNHAEEQYLHHAIASAELLAALLGKPTDCFLNLLYKIGKSSQYKYKKALKKYKKERLLKLIPDALKFVDVYLGLQNNSAVHDSNKKQFLTLQKSINQLQINLNTV